MKPNVADIVEVARNIFGGILSPFQYKDYVFSVLFLKYVTEKGKYDSSWRDIVITEEITFNYLWEKRKSDNLGYLMNNVFSQLKELNQMAKDPFFSNTDFESSTLGTLTERNRRLYHLILFFHELIFVDDWGDTVDISGLFLNLLDVFANEVSKNTNGFYTPQDIVTLMVQLTDGESNMTVCDPTCGTASLLIGLGKKLKCNGMNLYGQEIVRSTCSVASMNLLLNGFRNYNLCWGDTIRNPMTQDENRLLQFDRVVSVLPFGLTKWGAEDICSTFDSRFVYGIPPKSRGDWAFISHMLAIAKEDTGKVIVVVPAGALFRRSSEEKIRRRVVENNLLEAVIALPENLFYGTTVATAVLIFNKRKEHSHSLFIDARQDFEKLKKRNRLSLDTIHHIVSVYNLFLNTPEFTGVLENQYANVSTIDEILEKKATFLISEYVKKEKVKPVIDVPRLKSEISSLETEFFKINRQIESYYLQLEKIQENHKGGNYE